MTSFAVVCFDDFNEMQTYENIYWLVQCADSDFENDIRALSMRILPLIFICIVATSAPRVIRYNSEFDRFVPLCGVPLCSELCKWFARCSATEQSMFKIGISPHISLAIRWHGDHKLRYNSIQFQCIDDLTAVCVSVYFFISFRFNFLAFFVNRKNGALAKSKHRTTAFSNRS